jgi:hypothetical protein
MNSVFKKFVEKPILFLLAINILVGLLVFRDYGFSWDEPLFYDYGDALGYAYSPQAWFSGNFDLNNSYGASGDDHKTRGPAYLLLAREPVSLLEALGLDKASAWHLINFLFFQLGVYFLYQLARRWMRSSAALAASALFSWQPLLWGHAFINPKDPPFLVFFLASVYLGFRMVDRLSDEAITSKQKFSTIMIPAIVLGITTSIRVLGPLAGLVVLTYAVFILGKRIITFLPPLLLYGVIALFAMFITWPFLWENPIARFLEVTQFMSDNPTNLSVLFGGFVYRADELPRRYLPFMLATTLTEPVWPLFFMGLFVGYFRILKQNRNLRANLREAAAADDWRSLRSSLDSAAIKNNFISLTLVLLWFVVLVIYVLLRNPSLYDGLRHLLFILPPIFIFAGIAFDFLTGHIAISWLRAGLILILIAPGIAGILQLHPYEYTYYNSFVGGTGGVFRRYETDYWLTCYKEAMEKLNQSVSDPANLYVHREAYIAAYYANENFHVQELRGALDKVKPGDIILVNTRTNEDRKVFKDTPIILQIARGDAIFCTVRQIP